MSSPLSFSSDRYAPDGESEIAIAERHTDPLDQASALEMEAANDALRAIRRASKSAQEARPDGTYAITDCDECGDEIGEQRLAVAIKNTHCIHCASAMERRR